MNRLAEETAELKAANLAAQRVFADPAAKAGGAQSKTCLHEKT